MKSILELGIGSLLAMATVGHEMPLLRFLPPAPSNGVKNHHRKIHTSRYMPHQGKRECARRLRQPAVLRALAATA